MNGDSVLHLDQTKKLTEEQQACIDILSELFDEAKRGNIDTVGLACRINGKFVNNAAGLHAGGLVSALFNLMVKINFAMEAVMDAPQTRKSKSSIIRPGRA